MPETGFALPPRWRAVRLLGRGGQALVWLAEDLELGESVAVKVFHAGTTDAARERLRREVRLGRTLEHPGLVRVFELIEAGDRLAVVMELLPGGSVAQRLEAGPLPIDEVVRIAEETLDVLAFLHRQGVVHRDVKPSNLLLDGGGRVHLADLGLVRQLEEGGDLTRSATTVGTPQFMSPEQIRGERAGPPADLYSLGVTLFHLLTGAAPFAGASEFEVAHRHLRARPPDPRGRRPDCPRWLARFVLRLLEKGARDRFRDGGAALEALRRRRAVRSPRRWRRALVAGVTLAVLAGAVWGLRSRWERSVARATVAGNELVAADAQGREVWRRRFDRPPLSVVVADLLDPGSRNVALSNGSAVDGHPAGSDDITVLAAGGETVASIASTLAGLGGVFPDLSDRVAPPTLVAFSLDRTGRSALAWITPHRTWYPSVVGEWSPRAGVQAAPLLYNSGHMSELVSADLDGDGLQELVAVGLNNPLGYQGVLVVLRPNREWRRDHNVAYSPDLTARWSPFELVWDRPLVAYTPVGQVASMLRIKSVEGGRVTLASPLGETVFDAAGNPLDSPLAGQGSEPRARFWADLGRVCLDLEAGRDAAPVIAPFQATQAVALAEAPMRLAADMMLGRALARGGRHDEAIALLQASARRAPENSDTWLRLGEQLAIAGRPAEAVAALDRANGLEGRGRGPVDHTTALAFLGAWTGEARWLQQARARWWPRDADRGNTAQVRGLDAVWAFCRGQWDATALTEGGEESSSAPWVQVLVPWAALERGADPRAVAEAAGRLREDPEVRELASLLRARSLTRLGDGGAAREDAEAALATLERKGRTNIEARVWSALAHRVLGDAAAAAGDASSAARHLRDAARIAPACWFGRRR